MSYFEHKGCYPAGNLWKDIFLVVPSPGDNKNLAGLESLILEFYDVTWKLNQQLHLILKMIFIIWKIKTGQFSQEEEHVTQTEKLKKQL